MDSLVDSDPLSPISEETHAMFADEEPDSSAELYANYWLSVRDALHLRCIFTTSNGITGIGPFNTRAGDIFVSPKGGKSLYVLRELDDVQAYRFGGNAWTYRGIHGKFRKENNDKTFLIRYAPSIQKMLAVRASSFVLDQAEVRGQAALCPSSYNFTRIIQIIHRNTSALCTRRRTSSGNLARPKTFASLRLPSLQHSPSLAPPQCLAPAAACSYEHHTHADTRPPSLLCPAKSSVPRHQQLPNARSQWFSPRSAAKYAAHARPRRHPGSRDPASQP